MDLVECLECIIITDKYSVDTLLIKEETRTILAVNHRAGAYMVADIANYRTGDGLTQTCAGAHLRTEPRSGTY